MTYDRIYFNALALLGEPYDDASTEDYAARALRLADFLVKFMYIRLGKAAGIGSASDFLDVNAFTQEFPFATELAAPMSAYLASWLIHSADTAKSSSLKALADELFDSYMRGHTAVSAVTEVYG